MKKSWFSARAASPSVGNVYIYSDIGDFGVTAESFHADLSKVGKVAELNVYINSNGGDVTTGFAVINMLKRHPARKVVHIDGIAASMASAIAMAGDTIRMPRNSMLMVHRPWGGTVGNAEQLKSLGAALDSMETNLVHTYSDRTGLSASKIRELMTAETWLTAEQAVELGFADVVVEPLKAAALARAADVSKFARAPNIAQGWEAVRADAFARFNGAHR